jgi:hypothetical protein
MGSAMGDFKLRNGGIVPLICPTCQNVFGGKAAVQATSPATLHGVVFDILVGSAYRAGLAAVFPGDDRRGWWPPRARPLPLALP